MHNVLFVNTRKAVCSIYSSGLMFYESILQSKSCNITYVECSELEIDLLHRGILKKKNENWTLPSYDFYVFNYHDVTMRAHEQIYSENFVNLPGKKFTIVLEIETNDPMVRVHHDSFDGYISLDPSLQVNNNKIFKFPRPLKQITLPKYEEKEIPVIGSFGFATMDKGFHYIPIMAGKEFEKSIVRINIPENTFVDNGRYEQIVNTCNYNKPDNVELQFTRHLFTEDELIKWCAENTINVFMYERDMVGLAAATDQAIISGRPLVVSSNRTFRHIHQYIKPYPQMNLKQSLENSIEGVNRMKEDWSFSRCSEEFDNIISNFV